MLKKKDKNYSMKRKYLTKTKYNVDENNNLYLTLPKFEFDKIKKIKETDSISQSYSNKKEKTQISLIKSSENDKQIVIRNNLEDLIPEFFENNETVSEENSGIDMQIINDDSDYSDLNEEEKNALFDKLRTKTKFISNSSVKNSLKKNYEGKFITEINSSLHRARPPNTKDICLNNPITNSSVVKTSIHVSKISPKPVKKIKETIDYDNDPVLQNLKKIKEKLSIIKKFNKQNRKEEKKNVIMADIFYYDKKKWEIQRLKESDKIINRLGELETKRKDWNDKNIPDLNLPIVTIESTTKTNHSNTSGNHINKSKAKININVTEGKEIFIYI